MAERVGVYALPLDLGRPVTKAALAQYEELTLTHFNREGAPEFDLGHSRLFSDSTALTVNLPRAIRLQLRSSRSLKRKTV